MDFYTDFYMMKASLGNETESLLENNFILVCLRVILRYAELPRHRTYHGKMKILVLRKLQAMDTAAITFIDELVNLTENDKFANDNDVKDKVERFAFDIILKCLLGDVNNDIQISLVYTFINLFKHKLCDIARHHRAHSSTF